MSIFFALTVKIIKVIKIIIKLPLKYLFYNLNVLECGEIEIISFAESRESVPRK